MSAESTFVSQLMNAGMPQMEQIAMSQPDGTPESMVRLSIRHRVQAVIPAPEPIDAFDRERPPECQLKTFVAYSDHQLLLTTFGQYHLLDAAAYSSASPALSRF
jgi:hypothetical protein